MLQVTEFIYLQVFIIYLREASLSISQALDKISTGRTRWVGVTTNATYYKPNEHLI